jgi:hypothetical protein
MHGNRADDVLNRRQRKLKQDGMTVILSLPITKDVIRFRLLFHSLIHSAQWPLHGNGDQLQFELVKLLAGPSLPSQETITSYSTATLEVFERSRARSLRLYAGALSAVERSGTLLDALAKDDSLWAIKLAIAAYAGQPQPTI